MSLRFEIVTEGDVARYPIETSAMAVTGPRCAVGRHGRPHCTFMVQSKLGINDFVPMFCHSDDKGKTWSQATPLWPSLIGHYSIFCNLSRAPSGDLFVFGSRTKIDQPREPFWCEQTKGLKANDLIWAISSDDGSTWSLPHAMPLPHPGSAEAPGPLLVTEKGRWIAPYSPYNLFDASVPVERDRVVAVYSDNHGRTWKSNSMIRFEEPLSGGAEAWVTQLSDGQLLGTTWQVDLSGKSIVYPNRYAMSRDGGDHWSTTRSTGIMGNTTALTPLTDRQALFITVRRQRDPGIWLSIVRPNENEFGILADQRIWSADNSTQSGGQAKHDNWTDFSFGEPSATLLRDGTLLLVFWYLDASSTGVRFIQVRMKS